MRRIYGIDFKNPFTMSNTRSVLLNFRRSGTVSLHHLDILVERLAHRAPVSRSQAAPCGRALQRWPILETCEPSFARLSRLLRFGGAYRDRTDDLLLAKQPLSQLS